MIAAVILHLKKLFKNYQTHNKKNLHRRIRMCRKISEVDGFHHSRFFTNFNFNSIIEVNNKKIITRI